MKHNNSISVRAGKRGGGEEGGRPETERGEKGWGGGGWRLPRGQRLGSRSGGVWRKRGEEGVC